MENLVWSLGHGNYFVSKEAVCQRFLGACFGCDEIGHWSRECPRSELVVQIESTYVTHKPRTPEVFFYGGKDDHFSWECTWHRLVNLLGSDYVSHQVRALRVLYKYRQISQ